MALVQGEFYSEALGMDTQITALIPEPSAACTAAAGGRNFPTLYILHGATGTHMDTVLQTELVQLVHIHFPNLAVVMPSGNFSFWTDYQEEYKYGHQYMTYVSKELVSISRSLFPLSGQREDTAIYGLSMGGSGFRSQPPGNLRPCGKPERHGGYWLGNPNPPVHESETPPYVRNGR